MPLKHHGFLLLPMMKRGRLSLPSILTAIRAITRPLVPTKLVSRKESSIWHSAVIDSRLISVVQVASGVFFKMLD